MRAVLDESIDEEPRQMARRLAPVAVFQGEHDVARPAAERHLGDDTVVLGLRGWPEQGESTGGADGRANRVATGATCLEDHVFDHDQGVSHT